MRVRVSSMRHLLAIFLLNFSAAVNAFAPPSPDIVGDARWGIPKFSEGFRHYYHSTVKILSRTDNIFFPYYNFWSMHKIYRRVKYKIYKAKYKISYAVPYLWLFYNIK